MQIKFLTGIFFCFVWIRVNSVFFVLNVFIVLFMYSSTIYWLLTMDQIQWDVRIMEIQDGIFLKLKILVPSLCNAVHESIQFILRNRGWIYPASCEEERKIFHVKKERICYWNHKGKHSALLLLVYEYYILVPIKHHLRNYF